MTGVSMFIAKNFEFFRLILHPLSHFSLSFLPPLSPFSFHWCIHFSFFFLAGVIPLHPRLRSMFIITAKTWVFHSSTFKIDSNEKRFVDGITRIGTQCVAKSTFPRKNETNLHASNHNIKGYKNVCSGLFSKWTKHVGVF